MADNSIGPPGPLPTTRTIAGFDAACVSLGEDADTLPFWTVADLERYVDRDALLRADEPPEPPYWATCWSGARVLAARVPADAGRVVEIGCGLGVPGAVAARRGARVVFVDRVATPLAFVRETLRTNGLHAAGLVVADVRHSPWRGAFDLVLAAEVLYDRSAFAPMAAALAAALAPGGRILLADGHRIDTAAFYDAARAVGLEWTREDVRVEEEGFPTIISVVELRNSDPKHVSGRDLNGENGASGGSCVWGAAPGCAGRSTPVAGPTERHTLAVRSRPETCFGSDL